MDWTMIAGFVALAALMVGMFRDVKGDIRDVRNDNREIRQDFGRRLDDLRAETREQVREPAYRVPRAVGEVAYRDL